MCTVLHPLTPLSTAGDIYLGTSIISGEEVVVELKSVEVKYPQLRYESNIYLTYWQPHLSVTFFP